MGKPWEFRVRYLLTLGKVVQTFVIGGALRFFFHARELLRLIRARSNADRGGARFEISTISVLHCMKELVCIQR